MTLRFATYKSGRKAKTRLRPRLRRGKKEVNKLKQLVVTLEGYYAKLPALPLGARDFLVSITPWLALVFGVLMVLFSALGLLGGAVLSPFAAAAGTSGLTVLLMATAVLGIAEGVLMVAAFSPLKKRLMKGWMLLFWVEVLQVVGAVLTLNIGSVVWGVLGAAIGLYFLFQIKSYYK